MCPYVEKKRSDARPVMSYDKVFLVKLLDYLRKWEMSIVKICCLEFFVTKRLFISRVCLNTVYFAENWKLKIIKKIIKIYCSLFFYCSYALVHCHVPWTMHQALVFKKKKKKGNTDAKRATFQLSKPHPSMLIYFHLIRNGLRMELCLIYHRNIQNC